MQTSQVPSASECRTPLSCCQGSWGFALPIRKYVMFGCCPCRLVEFAGHAAIPARGAEFVVASGLLHRTTVPAKHGPLGSLFGESRECTRFPCPRAVRPCPIKPKVWGLLQQGDAKRGRLAGRHRSGSGGRRRTYTRSIKEHTAALATLVSWSFGLFVSGVGLIYRPGQPSVSLGVACVQNVRSPVPLSMSSVYRLPSTPPRQAARKTSPIRSCSPLSSRPYEVGGSTTIQC